MTPTEQERRKRERAYKILRHKISAAKILPKFQRHVLLSAVHDVWLAEQDRFRQHTKRFEEASLKTGKLIHTDQRVGLLHREGFKAKFRVIVNNLASRRGWCAVGFIDARFFKGINSVYGHLVGDAVMETIARFLEAEIRVGRGEDIHGRWGGDEFCFALIDLPEPEFALQIMERFGKAIAGYNWGNLAEELNVILDIGLVIFHPWEINHSLHDLVKKADPLMFSAKQAPVDRGISVVHRILRKEVEDESTAST
ncbi:MAG: GGDEF domain-containing protein [bacterium]|nr:GGDEF domain-containing protein [bacterium]